MLQEIREKTQGWFAWVIVIMISIPFALWGIQEYLGIGGEPKAASVNDRDITERELDSAFQRFRLDLREQLGANYRAGLIDDRVLKRQVLNSMVQQELLMQQASANHMNAGDEMVQRAIASYPAFQKAGHFDYPTYQRGLRQQGVNPDQFAQRTRSRLILDQLGRSIQDSEFTTKLEFETAVRLKEQKRELAYLLFTKEALQEDVVMDDQRIQDYYAKHQDRFKSAERVKLRYVELSVARLAKEVKVDEAGLQTYLDAHRDDFRLPEERSAAHILIPVEEGKEEPARQQAEALLARVKGGENFADLARQESKDPGSAQQGGELGFFARGLMDPAFEEAAFSLKPGELSGLVRSAFGFHLIKLKEVRGGGEADLAAVRDRVEAAYRKEEAQRVFYEHSERMSTLAYENPASLEPVEEQLGVKIQTSDWLARDGAPGVLGAPQALAAAFSEEVLLKGNNSEPLELGPEQILILRVNAHEAAETKPLEQVREAVIQALKQELATKRAAEMGTKAKTELQSGKSLTEVAQTLGAKIELSGLVDRYDAKLDQAIRDILFRLSRPQEGQMAYGSTALANGDYAVVVLSRVEDGKPDAEAADMRPGLNRGRGDRYFNLYLGALEQAADIQYIKNKPGRAD